MYKLPEDLKGLGADELKALPGEIRAAYRAKLEAGGLTKDELTALREEHEELQDTVSTEAARRKALEDAADPEPVVDPTPEPAEEDPEVEVDPAAQPAPAEETDPPVEAGVRPVVTTVGLETTPTQVAPSRKPLEAAIFRAHAGVAGKARGDSFTNWADVAATLMETAKETHGSGRKHVVGVAEGNFDPRMVLGDSMHENLKLFERDEITAALCAPLPPVYDLACMNTTRRPVKASLPTYRAPRGGVTVMSSPTLEDITTGFGIWDRDDDANPNAVKETCQTIQCNSPSSYYMYAVYRCMTVKNMLAMTYPELVEAWLNRLAARQARLAETQLLEAMAVDTTTIQAHTLGYNASVSIITNLLNYLVGYQELQRWDVPEMDAWVPRWLLYAIKADMMRRRRTDGGFFSVPSDAAVNALFTGVGITPHWFIDTPSWATPVPRLQVTGQLGQFTRNLEILVAPRGKFAVIDRGELNFGVNNVMRDNTSLSKNEYTLFFENWEGIVNTTSCPAHVLEFNNLCFNGQQIADVVINCEGGDEVGAAS
jgi:hypothetical protein